MQRLSKGRQKSTIDRLRFGIHEISYVDKDSYQEAAAFYWKIAAASPYDYWSRLQKTAELDLANIWSLPPNPSRHAKRQRETTTINYAHVSLHGKSLLLSSVAINISGYEDVDCQTYRPQSVADAIIYDYGNSSVTYFRRDDEHAVPKDLAKMRVSAL